MKSIALESKKVGQEVDQTHWDDCESWLDRFSRKCVLATLAKIGRGHLSVEELGKTYSFGQCPDEAEINARIVIKNPIIYRMVLFHGSVGSGEAYMKNAWWSPDLLQVIRIFVSNMDVLKAMDTRWSFFFKMLSAISHRLRKNNKIKARKNISAHYDLGNEFFSLFLDKNRMYSSAIYPNPDSCLERASEYKLEHICDRLQLNETDHLLEIGTGWGGMAVYAAKSRGCRVTSVTISLEQHTFAKQWVENESLQHLVEVKLQDYRDIEGQFDKLVSVEMVEAVGYQYYSTFFAKCCSLLKDEGLMLMQAITIADQRYRRERDRADFIQTYIFPGGCLPSNTVIAEHISEDTDMQIIGLEDITCDYARTLAEWKKRFFQNIDQVREQGFDEAFVRMWEFYFSYCEGGFTERVISTAQFLFARPQFRGLPQVAS